MKAIVAAFNQEKALVGAFSVITNLRMELFQALVQDSGRVFHILVIVADGQMEDEGDTAAAIVQASSLPLSIVLVGVGDGPWDIMEDFDDNLPARKFDNFQFVNFHSALKDAKNPEASVALASLMEVPSQYQTMLEMGYFSKCSSNENKL